LCRLAARTPAGAHHCYKGCGIAHGGGAERHQCPLGLAMLRHESRAAGHTSHWIGRRFVSVDAMHAALDQLMAAGFDEETVLEHLPPNPVLEWGEMRRIAAGQLSPAGAQPETSGDQHLVNVIEYLTQIHSLIASGDRPATVCDRFLRVLAGMLPFDDMVIYLLPPDEAELVIVATVDRGARERGKLTAHSTRLDRDGLGWRSFTERKVMIERNGTIEPLDGELAGPGRLAIPLPPISGRMMGVWIARRSHPFERSPLGNEPVRLMNLLAELLSSRLQQLFGVKAELPAAGQSAATLPEIPPAPPVALHAWDGDGLRWALEPEVARATRYDGGLALLHLRVECARADVTLPSGELTGALAASLRAYDKMARRTGAAEAWDIILPHANDETARLVGARLLTLVEDIMDARGGTEELGLRLGLGISLWGADAASAEQMIRHAEAAAAQAAASNTHSLILVHETGSQAVGQ
jgi:hypothetical protein